MAKMDRKILEELIRFNNLNHNANNLNESVANLGMGSHVERLAKRFNIDMTEQEDVEAGEEEIEISADDEAMLDELPTDDTEAGVEDVEDVEDVEAGVEDVEAGMEDIESGMEDTSDATELDVTDLVNKDEEISDALTSQKDILSKNTQGLEDLMAKLTDLETHLSSMDDMVDKISDLEVKIEKYRPKTPQEKMDLRKYDSGPFNNTLTDFFVDKEEIFDKTGKKEYILTPEEVEDYNESEIKKSFEEE